MNHEFGPEVAAVFKDKDLLEYGHRGREAPPRMRNDILKIGAKRSAPMQRLPRHVLIFKHCETGSCLSDATCRAKEQHALHLASTRSASGCHWTA